VLHLHVLILPGVRKQAGLDAGLGEELQGVEAPPLVVGTVMKKTKGKADADEVHRLVKTEVDKA